MDRIAIFIDGGYMDSVLRYEFDEARVSYGRLACEIASIVAPDLEILRTYYYHCLPYKGSPPTKSASRRFAKMHRFLLGLERLPRFEVRRGRLVRRGPDKEGNYRYRQKMVDVLLSIDLVQLSVGGKITHAALIAGDSDFVPAVRMARDAGLSVWLFHGERPHNELWTVADERVRISSELVDSVRWVDRQ